MVTFLLSFATYAYQFFPLFALIAESVFDDNFFVDFCHTYQLVFHVKALFAESVFDDKFFADFCPT